MATGLFSFLGARLSPDALTAERVWQGGQRFKVGRTIKQQSARRTTGSSPLVRFQTAPRSGV